MLLLLLHIAWLPIRCIWHGRVFVTGSFERKWKWRVDGTVFTLWPFCLRGTHFRSVVLFGLLVRIPSLCKLNLKQTMCVYKLLKLQQRSHQPQQWSAVKLRSWCPKRALKVCGVMLLMLRDCLYWLSRRFCCIEHFGSYVWVLPTHILS